MNHITNDKANELLRLPKKIIFKGEIQEKINLENRFPLHCKFKLISEQDSDCNFLWEITQSTKNRIRINFHHQENDGKIGLVRVDYNSGHKNPEEINEFVPEHFKPFAGKYFSNNQHHIHYHVQGYKTLAWAIPLLNDDFKIKELLDDIELSSNISKIIKHFAELINVKTKINLFNNTLL